MPDKDAPPPRSTASGADRLSALPDGVREHVLSFLPAHDAVRSSVLARSWRDLWTRSPALRITRWGSREKFTQFVEHLLLRLHAAAPPAPLDSCHFDFSTSDFDSDVVNTIADTVPVDQWIQWVLRCRVRVLRFIFSRGGPPLVLADMTLAVSEHLTKLELRGLAVCTARNLDLSGCLALQDLRMEDCYLYVKEIRAPHLKHLTVDSCDFLGPPMMTNRTAIHLPGLVSLEFTRCHGKTPYFATSMLSLEAATVTLDLNRCDDGCSLSSIDGCGDDTCDGCQDYYELGFGPTSCLLLSGLSEATNLELSADPQVVVFIRDLKFSCTFGKLKTLVLADWFVADGLSPLIWFLHHSPILEKLTLQISKVHDNSMTTEGSCKLLDPSIASSYLKIAEIKCLEVDETVFKILKILTTAFGVPLEQINIQCSTGSGCVNFKCTGFN